MRDGQASRSSMVCALLKAAHVAEDPPPWVFDDPLGGRLLTTGETGWARSAISRFPSEVYRALRVELATRSRLAEEVAVGGVAVGRRDYVLLGAGLDTFAWRLPQATEFTVWEIDHPDTQAWKRQALARAGLAEGPNIRFLPVDLAATPLDAVRTPRLATWNWLGVTMYLDPAVVEAALRTIASHQPGTTLVVNFLLDSDPDELTAAVHAAAAAAVAASHEPVVTAYAVDDVSALLRDAGFGKVELLDAGALRARYLSTRPDLLHSHSTLVAVATA
jgi:methyltransferase (TIGR00027 family)